MRRARAHPVTNVPRALDPDENRREGQAAADDEQEEHPGQDLNPERPR